MGTDYRLRAYVWRGLLIWAAAVWIAIIAFIAVPAARAIVEAASAPGVCAGFAGYERAACMGDE